jgi:hypothetical protein
MEMEFQVPSKHVKRPVCQLKLKISEMFASDLCEVAGAALRFGDIRTLNLKDFTPIMTETLYSIALLSTTFSSRRPKVSFENSSILNPLYFLLKNWGFLFT